MYELLLALAAPVARQLTRPIIAEAKNQIHGILVAISLVATGVACVIVGLTYFASSLWHALMPLLGTVGADLLLGGIYAAVAAALLFSGFRLVR